MNAHPHSVVSSDPYTYDHNTVQQPHIQIVDTNALDADSESFIAGLNAEVAASHPQLIYSDPSTADPSQLPTEHYLHDGVSLQDDHCNHLLYQETANPMVLPQGQPQQDLDIEPIDLEEVQKIQARMPAADPNAPIGSNKNPIRIIQQGNQYITTQDVSDEHLQQIIQVLTNQALISSSSSRPSSIYNRLTNRRIIFRVTKAKRRHDDSCASTGGSTGPVTYGPDRSRAALSRSKNRSPMKSNARKRRKRGSDEEDPDFEPEVPEEEILPFPLARRTSASGRVSKPPKHLVKDYKHLRLEDLTTKPESSGEEEHSDGGYSDYINSGAGSSDEDKGGPYPCSACSKMFNSRAGVSRHRRLAHGPNQGKPRTVNPYVAAMKRRTKLQEAVAAATDDELIEFAAPRLSKLLHPWDHLLLRSADGSPPLPQLPRVVLDYLSLVERARAFFAAQLELWTPTRSKNKQQEDAETASELPTDRVAQLHEQEEQLPPLLQQTEQIIEQDVTDSLPSEPVENQTDGRLDEVLQQETPAEQVTLPPEVVEGIPENHLEPEAEVQAAPQPLEPSSQFEAGGESTVPEELPQHDPPETSEVNGLGESTPTVEHDRDEEDEDEDLDDGQAIIVKIDTAEQSNILGLPCGKYLVKEPLCEDFLPRRFRSILAAQHVAASGLSLPEAEGMQPEQQNDGALVAVDTADDDEVGSTLRGDTQPVETEAEQTVQPTNVTASNDAEAQGVIALGDELLLVPEGGLGGPVPDEWLTNGAFLAVLTEAGELSDLVMEAATGRLFHRPTGHLVSLADGSAVTTQPESEMESVAALPDYGAYEDEQPPSSVANLPADQDIRPAAKFPKKSKGGRSKAKQPHQEQCDPGEFNASVAVQEQLLRRMAETGEVIDLNTLFPGVSVTEVSPGVCLVTKPNGDRFNVEHGGEGITLETLQTILQMDA